MNLYNKIPTPKRVLFLLFICLISGQYSAAQKTTDTLYDLDVINIIQSYEPILIGSDKIPVLPDVPKITKNKPDEQTYKFADVKGKITYPAEDIRPIKTAMPKPDKQKFMYAKVGFGNYLTPLVNLALVNPNQTKYRAGLNADFILSKSKKPKFQEYFDVNTKAFGEYFIKHTALVGASVQANFDRYHFYAHQSEGITEKDIRNQYNRLGANIYLKSIAEKDYDYHANIGFKHVSNTLQQKENTLEIDLKGKYMFMHNIGLGADIWMENVGFQDDKDAEKESDFSLSVNPYAIVKYKIWELKAGVNVLSTHKKLYVLPSIQNLLSIYKEYLVMYNEWNSNVKSNSMYQVSLENPFIAAAHFENQIDEKRTFAGLRGTTGGFYYDINFSQMVSRNQIIYTQNAYDSTYDAAVSPQKGSFQTAYISKLKSLNPHISLGYSKGGNYGAKVSIDYFSFNKNNDLEVIYQPKLKADITAFYNWKEKLFIQLNLIAYGKMNTLVYDVSNVATVNTRLETIKGVVDVNLSASYFFTKNIGVFIDLHNLAFQKYQRYINYPSYGLQAIGGVKISY
jgi:hypothetical protein